MNFIQSMADDTSAFNQAVADIDPAWVAAGWSAVVVVAGCVWASSRAGGASAPETASYPGEPQDLPDHRMSPSAAVVRGWRRSCTKAGRASRSEYWYFVLFVAVSLVLCHLQMALFISFSDWVPALHVYNGTVHPDLMVDEFAEIWGGFVSLMKLALPLLLCSSLVCATTRRLHDTGHSGWCLVLALGLTPLGIPSPLFVMPWLLQGSEPRRNAFGAVPTNGSACVFSLLPCVDRTRAMRTSPMDCLPIFGSLVKVAVGIVVLGSGNPLIWGGAWYFNKRRKAMTEEWNNQKRLQEVEAKKSQKLGKS